MSDAATIQDRISGRVEAEACLELRARGSEVFERAFAEAMRKYADGVLGAPESSLKVMTREQAEAFEATAIQFGQHRGCQYRDVPIAYLTWLADSANELAAYLRSEIGKRRIEDEE